MDKAQAEKALAIIRTVIENTHDDLVARNWGVIWMTHAFINLAGACSGQWIAAAKLPVIWYGVPLVVVTVVDIALVGLLAYRDQGVRSYIEWQLWGIWVSFLVFTLGALAALQITGAPPTLFAPLFALNCGMAFAMMGLVFYRHFLGVAALFLVAILLAAWLPDVQWWIVGGTWWASMFFPGLSAFREKQRRGAPRTKLL